MSLKTIINVDEKVNDQNMQACIIATLLKENGELKKYNDEVEKRNDIQFNKITSLEKDLEVLRKQLTETTNNYKIEVVRSNRLQSLRDNDFKEMRLLEYEVLQTKKERNNLEINLRKQIETEYKKRDN